MGRICLRTTEAISWVPGLAAQQPQVESSPAHGPLLSMRLVAEEGCGSRWKQVHIWKSTRQPPPLPHFVLFLPLLWAVSNFNPVHMAALLMRRLFYQCQCHPQRMTPWVLPNSGSDKRNKNFFFFFLKKDGQKTWTDTFPNKTDGQQAH